MSNQKKSGQTTAPKKESETSTTPIAEVSAPQHTGREAEGVGTHKDSTSSSDVNLGSPTTPNRPPERGSHPGTTKAVDGESQNITPSNPAGGDTAANTNLSDAQETKMLKHAISRAVNELPVEMLKHHPLSETIYTRKVGNALAKSIATHGILQPILVAESTMEIIAGNSRVEIAKRLEITKVPVTFFTSDDPLEIRQAVLETNNQREKTTEQKLREYLAWLEIEAEYAKRRMNTKGAEGVKNSSQEEKGKARDKAGAKIGMSGVTSEQGAEIITIIDNLRASEQSEKADQLLSKLNEKSINAASNLAIEMGLKKPSEKKAGSTKMKPDKEKTPPAPAAPTPPAAESEKITNHDDALNAIARIVGFIRKQRGNEANKGRTQEWKEAVDYLIESLENVGIQIA